MNSTERKRCGAWPVCQRPMILKGEPSYSQIRGLAKVCCHSDPRRRHEPHDGVSQREGVEQGAMGWRRQVPQKDKVGERCRMSGPGQPRPSSVLLPLVW